jgi:hypothetical protein
MPERSRLAKALPEAINTVYALKDRTDRHAKLAQARTAARQRKPWSHTSTSINARLRNQVPELPQSTSRHGGESRIELSEF